MAEVGAAFLGADLGLEPTPHEGHARTIASWIELLKRDSRAIFTAAGQAQRAVDFLQVLQPGARTDEDEPPTGVG